MGSGSRITPGQKKEFPVGLRAVRRNHLPGLPSRPWSLSRFTVVSDSVSAVPFCGIARALSLLRNDKPLAWLRGPRRGAVECRSGAPPHGAARRKASQGATFGSLPTWGSQYRYTACCGSA
ncbi:MAG: hypothetical protein AMXMBFR59_22420 [Rhodanobacteraceae bacterium]